MNKEILKLAIPSIISNITVPLLSSVDTALVGHLEGTFYLGGVAIGTMIFNFIYWGFGFLRMGTTGLTAQAYGEKDEAEQVANLGRAVLLAVIGGAALLLLQKPISLISFQLVDSTPQVEEQALIYYNLRIWASPGVLILYSLQGWFLGMQNARYPMVLAIFLNSATILLDIAFLKGFGMKTAGVALGSLIATYVGVVVGVFLFLYKYRPLIARFSRERILDAKRLRRYLDVNRDIFLRTLLLIVAYTFFTVQSAKGGDTILAANSVLMQLWMILAYGIDGFAYAAESLVGRFIGSGDRERLKNSVTRLFWWGLGLSAAVSLVYWLFGESIVRLYTDKPEVIAAAMAFYVWTVFAPLVNAVCFIWDGVFIGATATRAMLLSMLLSTAVFFLPVYYLTRGSIGNHSLWLAMTLFMVVRGVTLSLYARREVFGKVSR